MATVCARVALFACEKVKRPKRLHKQTKCKQHPTTTTTATVQHKKHTTKTTCTHTRRSDICAVRVRIAAKCVYEFVWQYCALCEAKQGRIIYNAQRIVILHTRTQMGRDINNCACRHTAAVGPWLCYLLALTTTQLIFHSSFFSFSSSTSSSSSCSVSNMYTHIFCTFGSTAPFGYLRGICATLKKQCVALRSVWWRYIPL